MRVCDKCRAPLSPFDPEHIDNAEIGIVADFCKDCADEYRRITELWVTGKDDTFARLANIKNELHNLSFDLAQRANRESENRYKNCYTDRTEGFSEGVEHAYRESYNLIEERFHEVLYEQ